MNADEFDAVTCALVGKMYVENNYRAVGNPEEGVIIIPRKKHSFWLVLRNH